jgi:hypothetical protein
VVALVLSWSFTIYSIATAFDGNNNFGFPSYVLGLLALNNFIYLGYYIAMKYQHGERVSVWLWALLVTTVVTAIVAIYFFQIGPFFANPSNHQQVPDPSPVQRPEPAMRYSLLSTQFSSATLTTTTCGICCRLPPSS